MPKRTQASVEFNNVNMELRDKRYNDIRLIFHEEEHKYNDSLGNDYISTTTILHGYQPKFDKNYWLRKKSKELGISEKKLEEQWSTITKEACERGTNTHNGLEDGVKGASMFQQAINYLDKREDGVMVTIADIPNFGANYKLLNLKDFIELTNNRYPLIYNAFKMYTERGYKIYSEIGMFLIPSAFAASSIHDEIKSPILSIANAAAITPPNLVNAEDRRPDTLLPISSNFLLPVSADLDIFSSSDFN